MATVRHHLLVLLWVVGTAGQTGTAPVLSVDGVAPFIWHFLVTVTLDQDGTVYCGALKLISGTTHTPSIYELVNNVNLDGHGSTPVPASNHGSGYTNMVVNGLTPSTLYDVYCYAVGDNAVGMDQAGVAATRQASVSTATGGDYVAPTLTYRAPSTIVTNFRITVRATMSEDGTLWCVAMQDHGSGTSAPSASEIKLNINVDAWSQAAITSAESFQKDLHIDGLSEATTYDVYCFAIDMSGNGMDGTPAWVADPTVIANTKIVGVTTLAPDFAGTSFQVTTSSGLFPYSVEPAAWNTQLPRCVISGNQERRDIESWSAPLSFQGAYLVSPPDYATHGCQKLVATPPRGGPFIALLRRGKCAFREKASRAAKAGYSGIVVIDHQENPHMGRLPDMDIASDSSHPAVTIPGWIIGKTDGEFIALAIATTSSTLFVRLDVTDITRKPKLGNFQADNFGQRLYNTW